MEWTAEQKKVIDLRDRNILVSAAAGSGKTAVLVERIMSMITDSEHPVDIDRLLVVTFTNAAAGQMKDRIGKELEKRIAADPDDPGLRRQEDLLASAHIMTIDKFCLWVVKNYFSFTDLDPDFRIGSDGELKQLQDKAVQELLEECYGRMEPDFMLFAESYARGKTDNGIAELIMRLYGFAEACPDTVKQLEDWLAAISDPEADICQAAWMESIISDTKASAADITARYEEARKICRDDGGPAFYENIINSDLKLARSLAQAGTYDELCAALKALTEKGAFVTRKDKKGDVCDETKRLIVADQRDILKKKLKGLADSYLMSEEPYEMLENIDRTRAPLAELLRLTIDYHERYSREKRRKNLVDFADVEHYALKILSEESAPAQDLRESFHEIIIDEYQDSNLIQEEILRSVSGESLGNNNIFMVGDVKQSIYKFRKARPELFIEKYDTYSAEDGPCQRVDLHKNFRSRPEIIDTVNFILSQLMTRQVGGIDYDADAALVRGREVEYKPENAVEVLLIDTGSKANGGKKVSGRQEREAEALLIAKRIRKLMDPETGLKIEDNGQERALRYGDIVILLRSTKDWSDVFAEVLSAAQIPVYAPGRTGYFDAKEVKSLLDMLRVIDDPMQDIPLADVMMGIFGGFTPEDMAVITAEFNNDPADKTIRGLYGALRSAAVSDSLSAQLKERAAALIDMIEDFRGRAVYMTTQQLLRYIINKTGYVFIVSSMPDGAARAANVEMLLYRAAEYEKNGAADLFRFVRYIESLDKYSVDYGEAQLLGENANAVCIRTIHKSKGMEYPVVFLAGCGKKMNDADSTSDVLMHPDMGLAADYIDTDERIKYKTLSKRAFARQIKLEGMGEELRVLYVALTRARDKLIITGADLLSGQGSTTGLLGRYSLLGLCDEQVLPYTMISRAGSYLDWVTMALIRNRAFAPVLSDYGRSSFEANSFYNISLPVTVCAYPASGLKRADTLHNSVDMVKKEKLMNWHSPAGKAAAPIEAALGYTYPYAAAAAAPAKFSVSALKAMQSDYVFEGTKQAEEETAAGPMDTADKAPGRMPAFMSGKQAPAGADLGTIYHKVMELVPFSATSYKEVSAFMDSLKARGVLTDSECASVSVKKVAGMLTSPLGRRMRTADENGHLHREKRFVMGIRAGEISEKYHAAGLADELLLVQGVVDAYFEEDGHIVLVDYKTDSSHGLCESEFEQVLRKRYSAQFMYYSRALFQAFAKPVAEQYLYSFSLGRAIRIDD